MKRGGFIFWRELGLYKEKPEIITPRNLFCTEAAVYQEVFCKKVVLKNLAKFTGKRLCQNLFFNKVSDLRPATLFKKRLWHRCFPVKFAKFSRTPFMEHLWWLLLLFAVCINPKFVLCMEIRC